MLMTFYSFLAFCLHLSAFGFGGIGAARTEEDSTDLRRGLTEAMKTLGEDLQDVDVPEELYRMVNLTNGMKKGLNELELPAFVENDDAIDERILGRWREIVEHVPNIKNVCREYADAVFDVMKEGTPYDVQTMTALYYANHKDQLIVDDHRTFFKNLALREACCRYVLGPDSCSDFDVAANPEAELVIGKLQEQLRTLDCPGELMKMSEIIRSKSPQLKRLTLTQLVLHKRHNLFNEAAAKVMANQIPRIKQVCAEHILKIKSLARNAKVSLHQAVLIWVRNRNVAGFSKFAPDLSKHLALRESCINIGRYNTVIKS